jgi:hypothetical protein
MKQMKLIGLAIFAILALGTMSAASAIAEEGFLPKQATATVLGKTTTFANATQSTTCGELMSSTITMTTDEHGSATLWWLKCTAGGGLFSVNSLGDKAGEILAKVLFLVCLDPKDINDKLLQEFGLVIETDEPVHLELPAAGLLLVISGRVIGTIATIGTTKLFVIQFSGSAGSQTARSCTKGTESKQDTLTVEENESKKPANFSLNIEGALLQFPNAVEPMDS